MVSAQITRTAQQTTSTLQNRDVEGVAVIALSAAGGVIVSQIVAEEVADLANVSGNPNSNLKSLAVHVGSKVAVALGFGVVGTQLGGLGLVAGAFMAIGSLASAGADTLDYVLNSGPLAGDQLGRQTQNASARPVGTGPMENEVQFRNRSHGGGGTKTPDNTRETFR